MPIALLLVFVALLVPQAVIAAPSLQPHASRTLAQLRPGSQIADFDLTYGIYVAGKKVGMMRTTLQRLPAAKLSFELHAQVGGMGRVSQVSLKEERRYSGVNAQLNKVHFSQAADESHVEVDATRQGKLMKLVVHAGGSAHRSELAVTENLEDTLVQQRLASGLYQGHRAQEGDKATSTHFDAATQKVMRAKHSVTKIASAHLGGIDGDVVAITTEYPELSVSETSRFTREGKLLTTQMGGLFEARLEPPEIARQRDAPSDLLLGAVVKAPHPLADAHTRRQVVLTLTGVAQPPPKSERQQVVAITQPDETAGSSGGAYRLTLSQDAPLAKQAFVPQWGRRQQPLGGPKVEDGNALLPSAFIQSDHPEIRGTALRAVKGAATVEHAIAALCHFTHDTVTAAYVPAFSNALEVLHTRRGDCTEYSVLFVALARAIGLPARPVVGLGYWAPGEGFGWHAWAEVWADGRWVAVDPTWNQTNADATHIKLAEGDPQQQAHVAMLMGRLRITELAQ